MLLRTRPFVASLRRAAPALLFVLWMVSSAFGSSKGSSARVPPALGDPSRRASAFQDRSGSTGSVHFLRSPASKMILIRASTFTMGSNPEEILDAANLCADQPLNCEEHEFSDERPAHRVALSAFWLDRAETTVAEYERCVELGRCRAIPYAEGGSRFRRPGQPVSMVTFHEAEAFCAHRGARLPTEAEFERAARGTEGRRFPWGDLYNSGVANHGRRGLIRTDETDGYAELAPVGSFAAGGTKEGFMDLAGNVAEWVSDRYAEGYSLDEPRDPRGPPASAATPLRVIRGGGFRSGPAELRGAARSAEHPDARRPDLGFRCARSAKLFSGR